MTVSIRPEAEFDRDSIFRVNHLAFGRDDEARLVEALRDGGFVRLSLVAETAGQIVGHILFSALMIEGRDGTIPALALAPLAVAPDFQRRGTGSALVCGGLDLCREQNHRIVMVVGDPPFYSRFGFTFPPPRRLCSPYAGESFLVLELEPGALRSVTRAVHYPPPFADL
jgi:putative acetyltransferase